MKPEHQRALARVAAYELHGIWMSQWDGDSAMAEVRQMGLVWGGQRVRLTPDGREALERLPAGFSVTL